MKNLININGKSYNKCEVKMLPTDKHWQNWEVNKTLLMDGTYLYFNKTKRTSEMTNSAISQELYIISDEEIKEGENFFRLGYGVINKLIAPQTSKDRKIIATTDESLGLARLSDDFLKAFVKAQGKITEVLVEYEKIWKVDEECPIGVGQYSDGYKLKISPDNTITIKPIQEEKTSWNREEMIEMIKSFSIALQERKSGHVYDFRDKWIKENL